MFNIPLAINQMSQARLLPPDDIYFFAQGESKVFIPFAGVAIGFVTITNPINYICSFNPEKGILLFEIEKDGIFRGDRIFIDFREINSLHMKAEPNACCIEFFLLDGKKVKIKVYNQIDGFVYQMTAFEVVIGFLQSALADRIYY